MSGCGAGGCGSCGCEDGSAALRYPPVGVWRGLRCACTVECATPCDGSCGCEACVWRQKADDRKKEKVLASGA